MDGRGWGCEIYKVIEFCEVVGVEWLIGKSKE